MAAIIKYHCVTALSTLRGEKHAQMLASLTDAEKTAAAEAWNALIPERYRKPLPAAEQD